MKLELHEKRTKVIDSPKKLGIQKYYTVKSTYTVSKNRIKSYSNFALYFIIVHSKKTKEHKFLCWSYEHKIVLF